MQYEEPPQSQSHLHLHLHRKHRHKWNQSQCLAIKRGGWILWYPKCVLHVQLLRKYLWHVQILELM